MGTFAVMNSKISINKVTELTGHKGSIYALESAGIDSVYSAGSDKIVALWSLNNPDDGKMLVQTTGIIYSLLKIKHLNLLLVGQSTGGIHLINLESGKEERLLQYHTAPVFNLMYSPKSNLLFSLAGDGELGVLQLPEFNLIKKMQIGKGKLRSVAINTTETLIALGSGDGSIYIFSLLELQPIKHFEAHQEGFSVNALQFSPDNKYLLSGSRDAYLNVFDVENNFEKTQAIPAHNYAIYSISYSPNRKLFATGSRDKTVKIWDATTFEMLYRIDKEKNNGHVNSVNKILWHDESEKLFTAGDDRAVLVWDIGKN